VGATVARVEAGVYGYQYMNIGSGEPHNFNQIAAMCARRAGYDPSIENLEDKPQGVSKRFCDPTLMLKYYTPKVPLHIGLRRMVEVYSEGPVVTDAMG